jgi:DNA-binding LytR/AlgR family response regulator
VLLPSFITFLVLVILKPFEFDTFSTFQLILWSVFFAMIVGMIVISCVAVVHRCFRKTVEEKWTIKNEILLILSVLVMISLVIYVLLLMLGPQSSRLELLGLVLFRTLAISIFPVLILVMYEQNHHQKIKTRLAEQLNAELLEKQNPAPTITHITHSTKMVLVAENDKVALQLNPLDLFFVKSEGNYVEVFYNQNRKLQKELIRNSLKSIEEQLSVPGFFRCHNRFLINLRHIQKAEGNARSLEISLANVEEKIPVSRSKSVELLQLLQQKD